MIIQNCGNYKKYGVEKIRVERKFVCCDRVWWLSCQDRLGILE